MAFKVSKWIPLAGQSSVGVTQSLKYQCSFVSFSGRALVEASFAFRVNFASPLSSEEDSHSLWPSVRGRSKLFVDDSLAVDNDGEHPDKEYCVAKALTAGMTQLIRTFPVFTDCFVDILALGFLIGFSSSFRCRKSILNSSKGCWLRLLTVM